jgi:epoxyqueuosine reductase
MRLDPSVLVPEAKSILCLAMNYYQQDYQPVSTTYKISRYAAGRDYHHVLKKKLFELLEFIKGQNKVEAARVFTDSAPVLERYWAQKAGIGVSGKNTCLILPRRGSFYFLAEIILDIELPADKPLVKDVCGNCTRCIDACPTGAITQQGELDARRCLSYLTIELKNHTPAHFAQKTKGYIFGCDICQLVCPHNIRFAIPCNQPDFRTLPPVAEWTDADWENIDKATFKKKLHKAGSPIARISWQKLLENIDNAKASKGATEAPETDQKGNS